MLTVFGCAGEERLLFERYAARLNARITCVGEPIRPASAGLIPPESAVSVSHMSPVDARLVRILRDRGVGYLSSRSVGLDHIDLAEAKLAGILVKGVDYSPESVAEYTVMLMLMAMRNARQTLLRAGRLDFRLQDRRPPELRDMTVGVVGTGRIGSAVIGLLRGFMCRLVAYDPRPRANVAYLELDELLRVSDLVTLHLPLTTATRHLLDRARIERMKRGAILINTARGALVDTPALADALERGDIASAALDVVEGEEGWFYRDCSRAGLPPFQRLLSLPNAIVTPHTAFYTRHALEDTARNTLQDYLEYIGGSGR
jgi:D-specific alpha-keto acid dehydrogenase